MKFYTYAKQYGNSILYRGYEDGCQIIEKVPFKPSLFTPSRTGNGEWKSLYNKEPLDEVIFDSIKDAKNFVETYKDVHGFEVHGFQKYNYQFINKEFPEKIEYDVSQISVDIIDIEVVSEDEDGFPDIQAADVPIVLISLFNSVKKKLMVFGIKDYIPDHDDPFTFTKFESEKHMLLHFVSMVKSSYPDAWTGWNTSGFDIPYLVNRIMRLFGEDVVKKLSPFGIVKERIREIRGKEVQTFDVYGIADLDYLELYKKYGTYSAKESYTLGFIAQEELGETKLELPGISFRDNYNNHFQLFVKYNALDTFLVQKLDNKMKLIDLAFAMMYMYKCNIEDIYKTVAPWEAFIFSFLAKQKIAVPPKRHGMKGFVEGAWVKEPKPAMYGWLMSFDFASLYPSVIRQWNISPETFVPAMYEVRQEDFINMSDNAKLAIEYAKEHDYTLAANGTMYKKDSQGFLAALMEYCMEGRKTAKTQMLRVEEEYQRTKNESLIPIISALNNEQMALKIAANAAYGAIGNEGFHYYEYRMAEAITLSGQYSDIELAESFNKTFNKVLQTADVDYVIYGDTDSLYLNCAPLVEMFLNGKSTNEIVAFLDKFGSTVGQTVINKSIDKIYSDMNCYSKVMKNKREAIASKALIRAKKNYAMYVHNSEGVTYDPPKIKVLGIEIVRSSTPQWAKKKLKDALKLIFEKDELSMREEFANMEKEFRSLDADQIAFPRGISDIDKWYQESGIKSKTPIHVRSAINYNRAVEKIGTYPKLQNGDKLKFLYLKMPNPIKQNVIGFPSNIKLPHELSLEKFIDYDLQFEKSFESPLKSLTDIAGWKLREEASLTDDDFIY